MSSPQSAGFLIDLNADLGEEVTDDAGLLVVVSSANVACGYHAGNAEIMRAVCAGAVRLGVTVGAQVSYADRENFGRIEVAVDPDVLREQVADQIGTLAAIAESEGTSVAYLKPHGALYHRTMRDPEQAGAVLAASGSLPVLGMEGELLAAARATGRTVWLEGFPDRGYDATGRLLPRGTSGALVTEEAEIVANALTLAPNVNSLCLHGDSPGAVDHARAVRDALERVGWWIGPVA